MNKTILYIDDDYQSGLLAKVFLEKAGYEVKITLDTTEARKVLENEKIDLIITDIGLPGENGVEFYEWVVRSKFKKIPVLLVSAHAMGFSHVLTEHRDIFFEKPIFFPKFIENVKKIIGE